MNLYQAMIEEIARENEQLLQLLGIPTLAPAPRLSEEEARLWGPSHIFRLCERNRVLREQIASTFPTANADHVLSDTGREQRSIK